VKVLREEEPELFDAELESDVRDMLGEAVDAEAAFAEDLLGDGLPGLSLRDVRGYLEFVADQRLSQLGYSPLYFGKNPLSFLELQDVQELTNFFERRVASYQVGVQGEVVLDGGF
jgi:ribonucleoside-diphosphate reductase beta chain